MVISELSSREQTSDLLQQIGTPKWSETFGSDACHPLRVQMLLYPLRVVRKLVETMPMTLHSPTWAGRGIRSTRYTQAVEHGGFLPPYTEIL